MLVTILLTALVPGPPSPPNGIKPKAEALARASAAPIPRASAGRARFLGITGDSKAARRLYDEMMARHAAVIEAFEKDPKDGSRLMGEFLAGAARRSLAVDLKESSAVTLRDHGEASLFLFVRSDPRFVDDPDHRNVLVDIIAADKLRGALSGPNAVPAIKELFLHWLSREPNPWAACFAFDIAESDGVDGAVPAALKLIKDEDTPKDHRAAIMVRYLAKFGGREHLKDLAPFLTDAEGLGLSQLNSEPELFWQFRDSALAACVRMSGQKLGDYGFKTPHSYGFPSDEARSAAFEKWKTWAEKNGGK
jgi:hypothetical protein